VSDGSRWESLALAHLQHAGLTLECRNHRCRLGEIDLLMRDGEILVAVEVRYRRSDTCGGAAASVTATKQARLVNAMRHYLMLRRGAAPPVRFDVVAMSGPTAQPRIRWLKAAFDAGA